MENFLYIRQRKTEVRLQQKLLISATLTRITTTTIISAINKLSPAEMQQQVEELRRRWEAQEKEKQEKEE